MSTHPDNLKAEIKKLATKAASNLYSRKQWKPRVIRHHKDVGNSTLDFIDYALPCFELAKELNISPEKVAKQLSKEIDMLSKNEKFTVNTEALSGYVNFMLDDKELLHQVEHAKRWYAKPHPLSNKGLNIEFLVVGINIGQVPKVNTTDKAYEYLNQVFNLVGVEGHSTYIIGDFSQEVSDTLINHLKPKSSTASFKDMIAVNRQVRDYLGQAKPSENSPINKIHKSLAGKWVHDRLLAEHQGNLINRSLLYESEISDKVHKYIDKAESIGRDKGSNSAWIELNGDTVPLRSSEGGLFGNAYLIYVLDNHFKKVNGIDNTRLIVVGSHRLSLLISSQISWLVKNNRKMDKNKATYFDPRVSKANIVEVTNLAPDLPAYFKDVASSLNSFKQEQLDDAGLRHAALVLIDTPYDLTEFIKANQYPGVFDAISQMCEAHSLVSS